MHSMQYYETDCQGTLVVKQGNETPAKVKFGGCYRTDDELE